MPSISIVIPVYNEASGLAALVERITALRRTLDGYQVNVLFVDDHSVDETLPMLRQLCAQDSAFRYLRLSRNSGSHVAILAGLEYSEDDCAVFLAADLQDPPELIPRLIEAWREGYQTVWAVRADREGTGAIQIAASRAFYWLLNRFGMVAVPPRGSDFALLDRVVVRALLASAGTTPSLGGEIARLGFRQHAIPYDKRRRHAGASKWTLGRKVRAFIDAFVAFSFVPLRFMAYVGIVCSLVGFLYAALVVYLRMFSATPIQGWASLIVVILVLGGLQMTMLGVLGEYLWRTLEAARRRPRFFVEEEPERREARSVHPH